MIGAKPKNTSISTVFTSGKIGMIQPKLALASLTLDYAEKRNLSKWADKKFGRKEPKQRSNLFCALTVTRV